MMTWAPCPHGVRTRGKKTRWGRPSGSTLDDPKGHHNYPSAADFSKEIRASFEEESYWA